MHIDNFYDVLNNVLIKSDSRILIHDQFVYYFKDDVLHAGEAEFFNSEFHCIFDIDSHMKFIHVAIGDTNH